MRNAFRAFPNTDVILRLLPLIFPSELTPAMAVMRSSLLLLLLTVSSCVGLPDTIRIGGLFDSDDESLEEAFISAVNRVNEMTDILPNSRLEPLVQKIPQDDIFQASGKVCDMMATGVAAIFGPQSSVTSGHVHSICDALDVPFIQMRLDASVLPNVYSINLYPHSPTLSNAYESLVRHWGWESFAILYEDNDGLVRLRGLFNTPFRLTYPITVRQLPPNSDNYRGVLREISAQMRIIVDCQTDKVYRVLKQAQQVGMMTSKHHYLVTSIDMDTIDLEDFRHGGTNITALRLIDPTRSEVVRVVKQWDRRNLRGSLANDRRFTLKTETALMFDAVKLFATALYQLDSSQHIDIKPVFCESENPWVSGNSLINYMKVVQMHGLSGIVAFNINGFRSEFSLDVMDLSSSGLEKIGTWNSMNGLNITMTAEKKGDGHQAPAVLRVTSLESEPYCMIKNSTEPLQGNDLYEGYNVDLIAKITEIMQVNYTISLVKSYGRFDEKTKEWDGIIKELVDKRADVGIGDITITELREKWVDFTTPFMNLGVTMLFQKPKPAPPSLLSFLSPFSSDVWTYMAVTYMGVSVILFVLARLSPYEWDNPHPCIQEPDVLQNDFGILNSMWFTIGSLMQQGSDIAPKAASTRMVAGIWWFFTLIMISSYTANLAAFLTVDNLDSPIKSVEDLARQTAVKCGVVGSGSTRVFFRNSSNPMYRKLSTVIEQNIMNDNKQGVDRVRKGGFAFFMESTTIEYQTERKCDLAKVGGLLDNKGYGVALQKGSPYRDRMSKAILQLQQSGELQKLKTIWWTQKTGGGQCKDNKASSITALGLPHVGGIFVVLLAGMGLASIVAVIEFVWKTKKIASYERDSICQEMIKELVFAVKCKGSKKVNKKPAREPDAALTLPLSKYSLNDREMYS